MKMSTKRNKAKKPPRTSWTVQLNLPPEIIQLYLSTRRTKGSPLHYVDNICTTKWWVPVTSRCSRGIQRRWPEFRLLGNSSNTLSWSISDAFIAIDPFDPKKKRMGFTSIVGMIQGKSYALSLQGALAVIERVDSRLTITGISTSRAVPSVNWRLFKETLFIMNDEIFLIFFVHERSIEIVDHVEVFRLCFDELKWIKMESLQGKTVFLDGGCCWVNSSEIGCRGDCVYFTQGKDNGWWIYDMQRSCISPASQSVSSN